MADDQVKYSDLISDDVAKGIAMLDEALKGLRDTMASLKDTAVNIGESIKGMGTATKEQQQVTAKEAAEIEALNKKVKDLTDKIKKLEDVKLHYRKLTDDQITSLKAFQAALQGSSKQVLDAVNAIEIEKKSYNELNAIYNTLKDSLNAMTIAERQNSEAGKAMTAQAAKIYDTMNELQKATGKYTLQVGKYRAAFDGLGYSIQQVVREVPSALNINQFMLAISNNIPMVIDQLKSFKEEQEAIKANLAQMTEGTKEYEEQQAKLMSTGTKLWKSILNWQTAVIGVLLLLRNINWDKIWNWFTKLIGKAKEYVVNLVTIRRVFDEITTAVERSVASTEQELNVLVDKLSEVARGTKEWKDIIDRVNELTQSNLDSTTATVAKVKAVTDAYLEQQRVLAVNAAVIDKLAEFQVNKSIRDRIMGNAQMSPQGAASLLGMKEGDEGYDEFVESFGEYLKTRRNYEEYKRLGGEYVTVNTPVVGGLAGRGTSTRQFVPATEESDKRAKEQMYNVQQAVESVIASKLNLPAGGVEEFLKSLYKSVGAVNPKDTRPEKDQVSDLLTLQRQLEDQIIANIENEYKRLDEEETKRHERFIQDQEAELAKLAENDPRRAVINQMIEEENRTHERKMEEIDEKRYQNLQALTQKRLADEKKAAEEEEKQEKENAKGKLKAAVDGWAKYKAKMVEEGKTRKQIVEAEVAAEIARLNLMLKLNRDVNGEIMSDEQKAKVQEWINLLERLQQTGNYGDYKPGQFMGKGGANVTNERKNYANIWEVLGIDMDNNQVSALNSVFDQAKEALNSWMDARKAAADQAKELADDEVSAAENALNREIELRNQGYANDVALREKELADAKAAQKKAAEEQKKVAQEQVLLDAALQTSSMITASANIIKQFPNPLAWAPMLALMWGTFAYAKTKAYQASTKSIKFKEGGVMLLEGGSHESGHDVNLGIGPDGSNLRAEGGEYFAVINKRSSRKYGSQIPAVVNALNIGMFEDRYIKTSDAVGLLPQVIRADNGTAVDLSSLEGGVDALVKQGESRWSTEGEWRVMRYKNLTRRVRIS